MNTDDTHTDTEAAMADQTLDDADFFTTGPDELANLIVKTEPGIGTVSRLYREMDRKGFTYTSISAARLLGDIPQQAIVGEQIDTLVVDAPGELVFHPETREFVAQLMNTRAAAGHAYPQLKRIVLVYIELRERMSLSRTVMSDGRIATTLLTQHLERPRTLDRTTVITREVL